MSTTRNTLVGLYPDKQAAMQAYRILNETELEDECLQLLPPKPAKGNSDPVVAKRVVNDESLRSETSSAGNGREKTGIASLFPTLFVSAPLVAPLMIRGYSSVLGGIAGAISGLHLKHTLLSSITRDALRDGYYAIVIHARDADENRCAGRIIRRTLATEVAASE